MHTTTPWRTGFTTPRQFHPYLAAAVSARARRYRDARYYACFALLLLLAALCR